MLCRLLMLLLAIPVFLAGSAAADYDEGRAASDAGDHGRAYREWIEAARQGDDRAQYAVGDMYRRGTGVSANAALAAEWIRKAAQAGNREARTALGELHLSGHGVRRDAASAWAWFRLAEADGDGWAGNQAIRVWSGMSAYQRDQAEALLERLHGLR